MPDKEKDTTKVKILPPNKIRYAYLCTNYFSKRGNLGNSCMRYKENQKSLNFYVKNNVRIVVAIDSNSKVHARALLWDGVKSTQTKKSFVYLDRVYTKSDSLLPLFNDLAEENNWRFYGSSSAGKAKEHYYIDDICIDNTYHFPYTDTFRWLFYKDFLITSGTPDSILKKIKYGDSVITLTQTGGGGYFQELDPNSVREVLTRNYISKKDAVFVKRYNGWVLKDNITDINGDYYSTHDSKIVKSPLDNYILKENSVNEVFTKKIIDKTKAVYLPKRDGYIHRTNIIYINGEIYHKQDTDIIVFRDKWYHISQCFINYDREKRNAELTTKQYHFWIDNEVFVGFPKNIPTRKEGLIPKECAIIAYNLFYSPVLDEIEYQEVYLSNRCSRSNYLILNTGTYILNSSANKQHLKKFNGKWYIKQVSEMLVSIKKEKADYRGVERKLFQKTHTTYVDFEAPNKKQLVFSFMKK